jgi:hypothetical protein
MGMRMGMGERRQNTGIVGREPGVRSCFEKTSGTVFPSS